MAKLSKRQQAIREKVEAKLRPITLPNFITLTRMAIVPFLVLAIYDKAWQLHKVR